MIWCVEDDENIREIEIYTLNSTGFEAIGFSDGLQFWNAIQKEKPELVILDVMLPGMDGVELLGKMKHSLELENIPVIMATARGTEYEKIQALDLGADDYIVKPFGVMELVSRVKAVLRRCQKGRISELLQLDSLILNLDERTLTIEGERVMLTFKEFELLYLFLSHSGTAFTREQLYNLVWNTDYMGDSRTLDMHIKTLRKKLDRYGKCIETVRHIGYRWKARYEQ